MLVFAVVAWASFVPLPISGTFLDPFYDQRLEYTNNATLAFSCSQWRAKVGEWAAMGTEYLIFQLVHDEAWGAFYPSQLPFMKPWAGRCLDVVGNVLQASEEYGLRVFLSCEWVDNESDSVTNATLMQGRIEIMNELASLYGDAEALYGWYFASEAYIAPYFTDGFLAYIHTLASNARRVTPGKVLFTSPYGTHTAVNDSTFVAQLQQIDVDIIAYQDEVGCIRVPLPVMTSYTAFTNLRAAHDAAKGPALWANVESFTWQDWPNNVSSPLIPAEWPRLLSQLHAVTAAGVDRVITFTRQGMAEQPCTSSPLHSIDI
jgi:hypothetical protein